MKFKIDHDFHIHSNRSTCSRDPEQTTEKILQYAKDFGLSQICITDHYWDSAIEGASAWYAPQNYEHIAKALPLPKADGIKFLFGCETEIDKNFTLGLPKERFSDFDFIIIPTTHMHFTNFTISEADDSIEARAKLWVERFEALLNMKLPFHKVGVAHLACPLINRKSRQDYLDTLDMIPDGDMEGLFTKAADLGCGIEINKSDMTFTENETETVLRPFRTAKKCGCKFYLGSDVHQHANFDKVVPVFERAITLLDLKEEEKFRLY